MMVQRCVNYSVIADGRYVTEGNVAHHTRNFLIHLSDRLGIAGAAEILPPRDEPEPAFRPVQGFEDMRLFNWNGALWCTANVRELSPAGRCQQVLGRIDESAGRSHMLTDWRVLRPEAGPQHEKNWMPFVEDGALRLLYLCDPTTVLDENAAVLRRSPAAVDGAHFQGGSQLVPMQGGWLAAIHEVTWRNERRFYQHRFIWFDTAHTLKAVSRRFILRQNGIEFVAGMAWHPDGKRLVLSYGVGDSSAWLATVNAEDVAVLLRPVSRYSQILCGDYDVKGSFVLQDLSG
jgi:hypothetical protein